MNVLLLRYKFLRTSYVSNKCNKWSVFPCRTPFQISFPFPLRASHGARQCSVIYIYAVHCLSRPTVHCRGINRRIVIDTRSQTFGILRIRAKVLPYGTVGPWNRCIGWPGIRSAGLRECFEVASEGFLFHGDKQHEILGSISEPLYCFLCNPNPLFVHICIGGNERFDLFAAFNEIVARTKTN